MRIHFRITRVLLNAIRADLRRPHAFASERVGFLFCRFGSLPQKGLIVLAHAYETVDDARYIDDDRYGAVIDSHAFRRALQYTLTNTVGIFHIHLHPHKGLPSPSRIDLRETAEFVPDFFHGRADVPHGAIILSEDNVSGRCWLHPDRQPLPITEIQVVGAPLESLRRSK